MSLFVFNTISVKLPNLVADKPSKTSAGKSTSNTVKAKASMSGHQKNFGSKLEMKVLEGSEDTAYSSAEESKDDRRGGWKMLELLKAVSKPC